MPNLRRRLAVLCGLALTLHLIGAALAAEPDSNVACVPAAIAFTAA
jgi:hypothetical protein